MWDGRLHLIDIGLTTNASWKGKPPPYTIAKGYLRDLLFSVRGYEKRLNVKLIRARESLKEIFDLGLMSFLENGWENILINTSYLKN